MQMLTSIMCLVLPLASAHQGGGKKVCLTSTTATDLLTRYFAAWTSPDAASVPSLAANAVTSDFTYTDETLNFGVGPCVAPPEGPLVFSRDDFVGLLQITIGEPTITDEKFEVLDVVVECEKLAVRWLGSGKAVGNVLPNITAKPGDPVRWKGIELMHVDVSDPKHPLVKSAQSSSDWFWFQYYTGAKVVFQKYNFGACLCQDVIPGIDKNGQCVAPPAPPTFRA